MNKRIIADTSVLLNNLDYLRDKEFMVFAWSLNDLQNIVNQKDNYKYKAEKAIRFLVDGIADGRIKVESFPESYNTGITRDDFICYETISYIRKNPDENYLLLTNNILMYGKAKGAIDVEWVRQLEEPVYKGYKEVYLGEDEMAYFYEHLNENTYELLINEYLIIYDGDGSVVDTYRWTGEAHVPLKIENIKSNLFGSLKPYNGDVYQKCLLNSFAVNKITLVKGNAGTGKTVCALSYLFYLLDKHKIDKIILFANTQPTLNTAKLGFYPGNRNEKLLESSVGNILSSKFGDSYVTEKLISENKLILIPMCDIRGYDTSGMNAGVFITEAQNLDAYLMKLALQRIGEDSICIIDGDYNAQVDSEQYAGKNNGMRRLSQVFRGHSFYGEVELKNIYRSDIAALAEQM